MQRIGGDRGRMAGHRVIGAAVARQQATKVIVCIRAVGVECDGPPEADLCFRAAAEFLPGYAEIVPASGVGGRESHRFAQACRGLDPAGPGRQPTAEVGERDGVLRAEPDGVAEVDFRFVALVGESAGEIAPDLRDFRAVFGGEAVFLHGFILITQRSQRGRQVVVDFGR